MNNSFIRILISIIILTGISGTFTACKKQKNTSPKPKGYFRLDFPTKAYKTYESDCHFNFEYPEYSIIHTENANNPCWLNLEFPKNNANLFLTYKSINGDLKTLTEDSREFAYQHTVKADAIKEESFANDSLNVYGVLYNIKGNVASNIQFYITDSTEHFLRGSLYFNVRPNKDSLSPAVEFIHKDIVHLMETTSWK